MASGESDSLSPSAAVVRGSLNRMSKRRSRTQVKRTCE